jgi:hypothetical protein
VSNRCFEPEAVSTPIHGDSTQRAAPLSAQVVSSRLDPAPIDALQQTVGNRAVGAMLSRHQTMDGKRVLARQPQAGVTAPASPFSAATRARAEAALQHRKLVAQGLEEDAPAPREKDPEKLTLTDLRFACFFIPASDPRVGAPLRALMRLGGKGHVIINATTLEGAMEQMAARVETSRAELMADKGRAATEAIRLAAVEAEDAAALASLIAAEASKAAGENPDDKAAAETSMAAAEASRVAAEASKEAAKAKPEQPMIRPGVRIAEIVLVAHGRPQGRIDVPLTPGGEMITADALVNLRDDINEGKHTGVQAARLKVLGLLDEYSNVIVMGCRAGQSPELTANLTAFFGGQANVYIPKVFYAVDEMRIGGPMIKDEVAAYDFLEGEGIIDYGQAYDDKTKKAWVHAHLPNGMVPESFLLDLSDEEKERLVTHRPDDPTIQHYKDRTNLQAFGGEKWASTTYAGQGVDEEMADMTQPELESFIELHASALELLQEKAPDDWQAIGKEAWLILRANREWSARAMSSAEAPSQEGDPSAARLYLLETTKPPNLHYDPSDLAVLADRRRDLRIKHHDAFMTAELKSTGADLSGAAETATAFDPNAPEKAPQPPGDAEAAAEPATAPPPAATTADASPAPAAVGATPPGATPAPVVAPVQPDAGAPVPAPAPALASPASGSTQGQAGAPLYAAPGTAAADLTSRGRRLLDAIAEEEAKEDADEQKVARLATAMLGLHEQWSNRPGISAVLADTSPDPLAGMYIPGLFYDTTLLSMKAAKLRKLGGPAAKAVPAKTAAPKAAPPTTDVPPEEDLKPIPWGRLPALQPPVLAISTDPNPQVKIVKRLGGFTYSLDWKIDKPILKYITLKKASLTFDGALDWKGEKGETELTAGGLGAIARAIRTGDQGSLRGAKLEASTYLDKDKKWKVKAGIQGGQSDATKSGETKSGAKWDCSLGVEYRWGDKVSSELKLVLVGSDSSKGDWTILGIKLSPVSFTFLNGELPIELPDGTKAAFTGKVTLSFEGSPNWAQIAPELATRLGPEALPAGVATGELVLVGGAVAGAVLTLYTYYRSIEDIQNIKELKTVANTAVSDFSTGFLTTLGFAGRGGSATSHAGKEGARHANVFTNSLIAKFRAFQSSPAGVERHRASYRQTYFATHGRYPAPSTVPARPPTLSDDELRELWRTGYPQHAVLRDHAVDIVSKYADSAVRRQVFDAFVAAHPDQVQTGAGMTAARSAAGLPSYGELPADQPDYFQLDNIYTYGSTATGPSDPPVLAPEPQPASAPAGP